MCQFVSWIEQDKFKIHQEDKIIRLCGIEEAVLFLTGEDVFETEKGKRLQKYCEDEEDYIGHGAIRHYYGLSMSGGINKECTDFSTPDNFPPDVVAAIKLGKMRGLRITSDVLEMLKPSVIKNHLKICKVSAAYDKAREAYDKARVIHGEAWRVYDKARIAYNEGGGAYNKAKVAFDEPWMAYNKAAAAYRKVERSYNKARMAYDKTWMAYNKTSAAYKERERPYNKAIALHFWDLFAKKGNRRKCWQ